MINIIVTILLAAAITGITLYAQQNATEQQPINRTINRTVVVNDTSTINRTIHRHEHPDVTVKRHVTTAPTPIRPETDIRRNDDYTITTPDYGELHGNSMHPMIPPGATVISEHYRDQQLERGMVIRYRSPKTESYIIHQIVAVYDDCVRTKGINRATKDDCIDMDRITHVIVGVVWPRPD